MKIPVEFDQLDIPFDMQFGDWLPASPGEPKAVLFVQQDLTPEQQAQARKNIGVEEAVLDILLALDLVPAITDSDGAVFAESDGTILFNL